MQYSYVTNKCIFKTWKYSSISFPSPFLWVSFYYPSKAIHSFLIFGVFFFSIGIVYYFYSLTMISFETAMILMISSNSWKLIVFSVVFLLIIRLKISSASISVNFLDITRASLMRFKNVSMLILVFIAISSAEC